LAGTTALPKPLPCTRSKGWLPARLLRDNKISYGCLVFEEKDFDELDCILSGKVYHEAETDAELPGGRRLGGPRSHRR